MEPRPVRAALLAGRAASRWALSSSTAAPKPSLPMSRLHAAAASRSFSSSLSVRQEAEAVAPGMHDYWTQRTRNVQQQQPTQPAQPAPPSSSRSPPQTGLSLPTSSNTSPAETTSANNYLNVPWKQRKAATSIIPQQRDTTDAALRDLEIPPRLVSPSLDDVPSLQHDGFQEDPIERKLRLRPVIGRTIDFDLVQDPRNKDFARGLTRLTMMCRVNRVNNDSKRQKFHERPGLMKKRLKTERWKKRFKEGFQATCARVSELARQGW